MKSCILHPNNKIILIMGNKEIYKDIPNYEGIYQVSNYGNVKSLERNVIGRWGTIRTIKEKKLKAGLVSSGYLQVVLCKNGVTKSKRPHQLVAEAFLNHKPNGHKLVVNHIDFNRSNNNIENLEIVTQRKNANQSHIKSTSKYTGVSWHNSAKKWRADIHINGKTKYLGLYHNESNAHLAYQHALKNI